MLRASDICSTLKERAKWTNRSIGHGLSTRLGVMEETITDVNLLEIAIRHEDHVLTKKFTRRQEGSLSGADWLWCIGEPGSWFLLLVQAKIINPKTGRCHYLNYSKGSQRSLLLKFARKIKAIPIYAIYSHIPDGYEPPPKASPHFSSINSNEWGCSWLTPQRVKSLVSAKKYKLEDVLRYSVPWAKPFCEFEDSANFTLGEQFANGLYETQQRLIDQHLVPEMYEDEGMKSGQGSKKRTWDHMDPRELLQTDIPIKIKNMLSSKSAKGAPISGISVISGVPIKQLVEKEVIKQISIEHKLYLPSSNEESINKVVGKRKPANKSQRMR